jgi:hypothetical protein
MAKVAVSKPISPSPKEMGHGSTDKVEVLNGNSNNVLYTSIPVWDHVNGKRRHALFTSHIREQTWFRFSKFI